MLKSHTLIFSLPFPSETRVSVDKEHPSSPTNYKITQIIHSIFKILITINTRQVLFFAGKVTLTLNLTIGQGDLRNRVRNREDCHL